MFLLLFLYPLFSRSVKKKKKRIQKNEIENQPYLMGLDSPVSSANGVENEPTAHGVKNHFSSIFSSATHMWVSAVATSNMWN